MESEISPPKQAPAQKIRQEAGGIIKSLGLVFGDIGTSPIYTLTVIFILTKPTEANVMGVLSLIIWTLTILVSVEYAWLAMGLGEKGEGGTIVLRGILIRLLRTSRGVVAVTILTFIGISLLLGDGVITPAISILSAVEGILLIPGLKETRQVALMVIASVICFTLFVFQRKGTEKVAGAFGPLMLVWFLALAVSGVIWVIKVPSVWKAINPYYGARFLYENGIAGFFVLSEVILCATGGEALYADMGHLGRKPIVRAWYLVFIALLLNYLGQGAFLIKHPGIRSSNVLFGMAFNVSFLLYIPFLILSIMATVIASQALISGMFSVVYQGINTRLMPMFKVEYTSTELRSQIYIGFVNWFLLISVLFIIFQFKESNRLAAAYGLAVTGTMSLTGIMMSIIFYLRKDMGKLAVAIFVTLVDLAFLVSNTYKIPHGGYWSLIIAAIPLATIMTYTGGQRKLYRTIRPLKLDIFLYSYNEIYRSLNKIKGTALFFARDTRKVPAYIVHTMFMNNIIYEDNIIVSITTLDKPFGVKSFFRQDLAPGLRTFEIQMGYMEVVDMEELLRKAGIEEKGIFYGLEEIATTNVIWKIFSIMKRLAPPFVQFHDLPPNKLHGVVTRIEL
ncbi:MAG: KUP/HAK/KT family potassium transporter [Syntrophorhabdus aromaticivorans]|uniref:Probable potassium transport system protein Kup n=1 Tax=Syntrophorhabdus aromaticivorans TaxID=328301 RepID=A0A971M2F6_9BACT|nr:KUP/HAK/KT family potassium transporter [Syntrophorhabdus aromaticivorans]